VAISVWLQLSLFLYFPVFVVQLSCLEGSDYYLKLITKWLFEFI